MKKSKKVKIGELLIAVSSLVTLGYGKGAEAPAGASLTDWNSYRTEGLKSSGVMAATNMATNANTRYHFAPFIYPFFWLNRPFYSTRSFDPADPNAKIAEKGTAKKGGAASGTSGSSGSKKGGFGSSASHFSAKS
ncbi:MAG: hypothetical protein HZC28_11030 [Spirochaetes bacterium]|nr:hypothetical protein [Spirochaetota bacterium]